MRPEYEWSDAWRPNLPGWSRDILPFYRQIAAWVPDGGVLVEVGTAWGRSSVFLAQELLKLGKASCELWTLDPHPASWAPDWHRKAMSAMLAGATDAELGMIRFLRTDSEHAARMFNSVDFVFVDGLHDARHLRADVAAWQPKIRSGGILSGHDYGRFELKEGISDHPDVKRVVDELFPQARVAGSVWAVVL
jgi:predicted O-methyltransferase YrrM